MYSLASGFFSGVRETVSMEDLAQSWTRLSLYEREGLGCCLTPEESVKTFSIAAKLLKEPLMLKRLLELLILCGEQKGVSKFRILVIIIFYFLSKTKIM